MPADRWISSPVDPKVVLSTLWIFAVLNYLYTDLAMMIFFPEVYQRIAAKMSPGVALGWTVFLETAIAMIVVSRVLARRWNRRTNIAVGALQTAGSVWTLAGGAPPLFYLFTATLEIACTLFIIYYAWTWTAERSAAFRVPAESRPTCRDTASDSVREAS